jgi:glycosyltransferase involved in cell wall biosynthesis
MSHTVVMIATSYPRFPGDTVGTFMEPIAHGIAARGHEVHLVLPWHRRVRRPDREGDVHFHFFRYAPHPALEVFGYASGLREDVALRGTAWLAAPVAAVAGWRLARRVARERRATLMHGHWVVPGGIMASYAAGDLPLVVSLHGSDVFVAERNPVIGRLVSQTFFHAARVTACSADLRDRAVGLGARPERCEVIPYGVDTARFAPDAQARARVRRQLDVAEDAEVVFAVGRFVRKKGFEYLIDATAQLAPSRPRLVTVLAGAGDLDDELRARAGSQGIADRVRFPGLLPHDAVAGHLAAADLVAVPSVRDDAGNVDGLPNVVMEALASATPVVATAAGAIGAIIEDGRTGRLVPERDARALAAAVSALLDDSNAARALGAAARAMVAERHGWARVAERFEAVYDGAASTPRGR